MLDVYRSNRKHGMAMVEAIKEPLGIILSSPKFIYLSENANNKYVNDFELAVRLSYFLWSSPPDEELYKLAQAGSLHQKEVLTKQVVRMLKDERSSELAKGFMNKWLEMERLDIIEVKNERSGPQKYNLAIEDLLRQEP